MTQTATFAKKKYLPELHHIHYKLTDMDLHGAVTGIILTAQAPCIVVIIAAIFGLTHQKEVPEFIVEDSFKISSDSGDMIVYAGKAPFDMKDRQVDGERVIVDGKIRIIKSLESYATLEGPRQGDPIGLIFEEENEDL